MWAESNRVQTGWIGVKQLKKWATGKGNASKKAVFEAARVRWPDIRIQDDNQADALWILDAAIAGNYTEAQR
jgi:Holliday junction resolvasome RuvABC endonuclease subunit